MTNATIAYLARAALQAHALHPAPPEIRLGSITLLPHQTAAVHWLQHRIKKYGGALLADPPGLGKTYVALAIAALRNARPLLIAPAALRTRWEEAAIAAAVPIDFLSTERLSAPASVRAASPTFVIVDEAHHLRTANTRRHRRTARLCEQAHVLLLTATPVHNRPSDLECITALFHLPPTKQTSATLRRLTLRRTVEQIHAAGMNGGGALHIPAVRHRRPLVTDARASQTIEAIASLPRIEETNRDGHPLLQLGLLHALRSSDAACAARVRHRIATTLAIEDTARSHVAAMPGVRKAWAAGPDAIQLAMPQLLGTTCTTVDPALAERAAAQRTALERILRSLDGLGDARRATALRRFARWCPQPVVAFTQFTETADALFRRLKSRPGIALLCGDEARIASGVVSREDVLARLLSLDRRPHTAVRLLITTDVLSEGLSLAGVATIVHLDLPWTAARLDQRVGRAARIAAPVPAVRVVELLAGMPTGADAHLRTLLHRKRGDMAQFERRRRDDLPRLALLRQLAASVNEPGERRRPGWVTAQSTAMGAGRWRAVALVTMLERRMLIVADDAGLRTLSHEDCVALMHVVASQPGASRRVRHRLRTMLRQRVANEQLMAIFARHSDQRLDARRTVDARLLESGLQQRLAMTPLVAATRRALLPPTNRATLNAMPAILHALGTRVDLTDAPASIASGRAEVMIHTGAVVVPG